MSRLMALLREPLIRLLLINLVSGVVAAALLFSGLLLLNPGRLRDLILADQAPATPLLLLLFGFVITFGSVSMGTAIMTLGRSGKGANTSGGGSKRREHDGEALRAARATVPTPR